MKKISSVIITSFLFLVSFVTASSRTEAGVDMFRQKNKGTPPSADLSKIKWENLEEKERVAGKFDDLEMAEKDVTGKIDDLEQKIKFDDLEMAEGTVEQKIEDVDEAIKIDDLEKAENPTVEDWKR